MNEKSCVGCKFLYSEGQGYSNYTWEDTEVRCAKDKNQNLPAPEGCDWTPHCDNWPKTNASRCELYAAGDYLLAIELLNKLVYAQPQNQAAKNLLADAFEQLGYQKESPTLRNIFLQGAYELRNGLPGGRPPRSAGPDVIRAMSTEQWWWVHREPAPHDRPARDNR